MGRINIEDHWLLDGRRMKLILAFGSEFMADGCAYKLWRMAQEFSKAELKELHGGLIPHSTFDQFEGKAQVIAANMVEVRDEGIYVRGTEQHCQFLKSKVENGRKGGQAKARALAKATESQQELAKASESYRNVPSSSISSSISKNTNTNTNTSRKAPPKAAPTGSLVSFYCDEWKARNGRSPTITAKDAGILKRMERDVGAERGRRLIEVYFRMPDPWYVKRGYDVATLSTQLAAIQQFEANGKVVTAQVRRDLEERVDQAQGTTIQTDYRAIAEAADAAAKLKLAGGGR